ncbi:MAG: chemotaxis protein CheW [Burkholderiales bacterium]|nr:chemotaxis protein CheW [Burkholderiales bacterium]
MARKTSLREYHAAVAERLKNLSLQEASAASKLGFLVGDMRWIINLHEIAEVLPVPSIVSLPLTRPYFKGICNVRGSLYGVMDFAAFLGELPIVPGMENRLLLLPAPLVQGAALLVSRMAGLRNPDTFTPTERQPDTPPWVQLYHDAEGNLWHEVDVAVLSREELFLNVGR